MELQVMLLDDEYIILDGLNSFPWEEYGCKVTALARNGLEGVEMLEETVPDLILSDVKMPGMDGLEFSEKAKEKYPDTTIVILTSYDSFYYAKQAIRIGVKEYLLKPIDYDILRETVSRLTKEMVCIGRKLFSEERLDACDKWMEEFACINVFEEIFDNHGIKALSVYNTATLEYSFILLFEAGEEDAACMERANEFRKGI